MKKFFSFIVLLLILSLLIGCGRGGTETVSTESEKASSATSRVIKKVRQDLLKDGFTFETDNENALAILPSPDTITYDSVYDELVKNDKQYLIVTAKVLQSKSFENPPDSGYSITKIKITKIHETNPKDIFKVGDEIFAFECFYETIVYETSESNAVVEFAMPYEEWYYSPMLVEDEEYIFFLADKTIIDQRTQSRADMGENRLWYNHAAFGLNFEYIEQYPENITTEELIKTFAEGKISKKTYFYQLHKDVLDKFNK